jgi:hypothetical protein
MEVTGTKPRYSVSRKGMGGRKAVYTKEFLEEILREKTVNKVSVFQTCKARGLSYVSINAAMRRVGLKKTRAQKAEDLAQERADLEDQEAVETAVVHAETTETAEI